MLVRRGLKKPIIENDLYKLQRKLNDVKILTKKASSIEIMKEEESMPIQKN